MSRILSESELEAVALQFREGKEEALSIIFNHMFKAIYHFCAKILKDEELSRDIAQGTFIKAWENRAKFESFHNIKSFLYLVSRNTCFNELGKAKVKTAAHKSILYLSEVSEEMTFKVVESEILAYMYECIEALSPRKKQVLKLFLQNINSTEIARMVGATRKTVLNQKETAIKEISKLLKLRFGQNEIL